jgi:hypothetical protein
MTLARLPWATILTETAALLKQANDLRASRTRAPVAPPVSNDVEALRQRVAELDQQQRADAEIMQRLATEVATIAAAAEATAARARQAYLLAIAGVAIGAFATLFTLIK